MTVLPVFCSTCMPALPKPYLWRSITDIAKKKLLTLIANITSYQEKPSQRKKTCTNVTHHRTNVLTHPPCFTQAREKGALSGKLFFLIAVRALRTAAHVTLLCGRFWGFSFLCHVLLLNCSPLILFHSGLNTFLFSRITCQLHQGGLLSLRYHRLDKLVCISTSTPSSKQEVWSEQLRQFFALTAFVLCRNMIVVPWHTALGYIFVSFWIIVPRQMFMARDECIRYIKISLFSLFPQVWFI